ncbi:MAG: hypothetical protein U0234_21230 [Sandaracinus sp.]
MSHIDDEPEPTEEELRAAAELARALDEGSSAEPGTDAAFAQALRATKGQAPKLAPEVRVRAVDRAMQRGAGAARTRARVRWLAAAAVVLITLGLPLGLSLWPDPAPDLRTVRYGGPTSAIFEAPFADEQRASERMDRITTVRAHDYFAAWAAAGDAP